MKLSELLSAVGYIRRNVDVDFAPTQLELILIVHHNPGITMPELGKRLGIPQGSLSRNIRRLSKYYVPREDGTKELQGFDFVRMEPDIEFRRRFAVYLTKKGEALVRDLESIAA